jgi:hypothetical protein
MFVEIGNHFLVMKERRFGDIKHDPEAVEPVAVDVA